MIPKCLQDLLAVLPSRSLGFCFLNEVQGGTGNWAELDVVENIGFNTFQWCSCSWNNLGLSWISISFIDHPLIIHQYLSCILIFKFVWSQPAFNYLSPFGLLSWIGFHDLEQGETKKIIFSRWKLWEELQQHVSSVAHAFGAFLSFPCGLHRTQQLPPIYPDAFWLVVWNMFVFPFSWECHHPNWRSLIFFRGVGIPPASYGRDMEDIWQM